MPDDVDVIVIGGGLMGAASAWSLTRRGRGVLLVEQFGPGHRRGSSHGSARIVRRAYQDALYTRLTGRSFELWRELEDASGVGLLRMLGGLDIGDRHELDAVTEQLAVAGVAHESLPAAEAEARWPGMRFPGPALFHPQAGTLDAQSAVDAFTEQATRGGATLRYDTAATAIDIDGDHARILLADGTQVRTPTVVVAAGAWVGPLLSGRVTLPPLRVTQQDVFHFPRRDPSAEPWPSLIDLGPHPVYHLAGGRDGGAEDDRKFAEHHGGRPTTAADRDGVVDAAVRRRAVEYVRHWLPGLEPTPRRESTCLYTRTESEDFVLDRVGPVVVCSPCSGHGAKFAPLIGELVADLVAGGEPPARFRLAAHRASRARSTSGYSGSL